MTGVVGALVEAWGEVRVHRARVVLSLVGVFLAVFAMTGITAAGTMGRQALLESTERSGGRDTTLTLYASPDDGTLVDAERTGEVYDGLVERFGITWSSTVVQTGGELLVGRTPLSYNAYVVEPDWGPIHRIAAAEGRWFVERDAERLAPAVLVNRVFLEQAGLVGRTPPFAVELGGRTASGQVAPAVTATVIGVLDRSPWSPEIVALADGPSVVPAEALQYATPSLEAWVPPGEADAVAVGMRQALAAQGFTGDAFPTSGQELGQMITYVQWAVRGVSLFALGLGALGVLNVGIVTVRQRIREIGVRRALGASSPRVFAAIMLESVCATALAGALGVALAVAVVVNLPLELVLGDMGITEVPPFPVSAAVEALVAATLVGALAGLVPATIAVRSKVIDAIRY